MRIELELDELVNGHRGILTAIEVCLRHECVVSGVALILCAIDSLAALTRPVEAPNTSRPVFTEWVERFLHPNQA